MEPPTTVQQLRYYRRFICKYALITASLEKLLKKAEKFVWSDECEVVFNVLKEKLASAPILVYPDWHNQFRVHIDALSFTLGIVLAQPRDGNLDHPIYVASRKLSTTKKNYTMTEHEALAMVYYLQKFQHYLLGGLFKFFTRHFALKYLVNKLLLEGRICRWNLLLYEFTFEVIFKPN